MGKQEDWQAIIDKAMAQARAGDKGARDWLGRYVLPDPDLRRLAGIPKATLAEVLAEVDESLGAEKARKGPKRPGI